MSSRVPSLMLHSVVALLTSASAALFGTSRSIFSITISITVSLDTNSQSPSDAITRNRSSQEISLILTSGLDVTPRSCANSSPMDLDMARPGRRFSECQTRSGPIGIPFLSSYAKTRPPEFVIRTRSSGSEGLWSRVSGSGESLESSGFSR